MSGCADADERFKKQGNIDYMSKWLRKSIRQCDNFKDCLRGLETFFKKFEVNYFPSDCIVMVFEDVLRIFFIFLWPKFFGV
jgi:hypothetical protein